MGLKQRFNVTKNVLKYRNNFNSQARWSAATITEQVAGTSASWRKECLWCITALDPLTPRLSPSTGLTSAWMRTRQPLLLTPWQLRFCSGPVAALLNWARWQQLSVKAVIVSWNSDLPRMVSLCSSHYNNNNNTRQIDVLPGFSAATSRARLRGERWRSAVTRSARKNRWRTHWVFSCSVEQEEFCRMWDGANVRQSRR